MKRILALVLLVSVAGCVGGLGGGNDSLEVGTEEAGENVYIYVEVPEQVPEGSQVTTTIEGTGEDSEPFNVTTELGTTLEPGNRYYSLTNEMQNTTTFTTNRSEGGSYPVGSLQEDIRLTVTFVTEDGTEYTDTVVIEAQGE